MENTNSANSNTQGPDKTIPVLLIVDTQKGIDRIEYWGGGRNNPQAEKNIKLLIELWRNKKFAIVFVQHNSTYEKSPLRQGQADMISRTGYPL
jgi:hypothetical protein